MRRKRPKANQLSTGNPNRLHSPGWYANRLRPAQTNFPMHTFGNRFNTKSYREVKRIERERDALAKERET